MPIEMAENSMAGPMKTLNATNKSDMPLWYTLK
jgi:hypothetical protein